MLANRKEKRMHLIT